MTRPICVVLTFLLAATLGAPRAQAASSGHDFDFLLGTWHTQISYLPDGTSRWVNLSGTVRSRLIWNGAADLEEIEANGPSKHFEGMTLRLYDAQTHLWNLYWANSNDGMLQTPMTGDFHNNTGTFYDSETVGNRPVFVRQRYFASPRSSYRFEQAISADGGKTWQPNFVAALTRVNADTGNADPGPPPAQPTAQHGFDWQFGTWTIQMSRLLHPFSGSTERAQYNGSVTVEKIWNGRANLAKIDAQGSKGAVHILALRLYLPQSREWSMRFANPGEGELGPPMYGSFNNDRIEFYDQEFYGGKSILDRFTFYNGTPKSARDEEAFSQDGGKAWETIWLNTRTRAQPPQ